VKKINLVFPEEFLFILSRRDFEPFAIVPRNLPLRARGEAEGVARDLFDYRVEWNYN